MNKENKMKLRSFMRAKKKEMGKAKLYDMSAAVCEKIMQHSRYKDAKTVMLYAALWDEVNIDMVMKDALEHGKRVVYPTVVGDDIIPVEITLDTVWEKGDFDILEPQAMPYDGTFDTVVVPGVAFDKEGNRLGRGKGYYDRFLAKHPNSYRLGVCFGFQMVDEIPAESFDLKMNTIVES